MGGNVGVYLFLGVGFVVFSCKCQCHCQCHCQLTYGTLLSSMVVDWQYHLVWGIHNWQMRQLSGVQFGLSGAHWWVSSTQYPSIRYLAPQVLSTQYPQHSVPLTKYPVASLTVCDFISQTSLIANWTPILYYQQAWPYDNIQNNLKFRALFRSAFLFWGPTLQSVTYEYLK